MSSKTFPYFLYKNNAKDDGNFLKVSRGMDSIDVL